MHSSLKVPLKLSRYVFCVGLPALDQSDRFQLVFLPVLATRLPIVSPARLSFANF